jgi:hypothetical protein
MVRLATLVKTVLSILITIRSHFPLSAISQTETSEDVAPIGARACALNEKLVDAVV